VVPDDEIAFMPVRQDVSAEELWGRVATIRQYRPLLAQMEAQVTGMQRLGKRLNQQFVEVDQELRLASRLQRDFLPRRLPEVGDLKFTAFYRPASWVSGDVYDVQRLDENHLGFYLADAVGHGVAAGLLTVFIKQAMIGKRITRERYEIVPPSEVLETLNSQLTEQELPNCQFVTAAYAVIHAETHELTYARGGHPHPIRIAPDGTCAESRTPGGLLGVFPNETYPSTKLVLGPGEKFVIYSDGLEDHILERIGRDQRKLAFTESFQAMARLDIDGFMQAFTEQLDQSEGSLAPHDDMTMVVVERKA
jgi:serine phosphatase RsbU (regulator of sigma subunit)